ncbi:MAG: non-heme iron oxygenase ferredoxin subunit [Thermomicrobiales bacterium]
MEFVKVARVSDVAPGVGLRVDIGDEAIAIFNLDGEFYAIGDVCTHEETSLADGDVFGDVVECPLHGAEFDIKSGKALSLPAVLPVPTYAVRVEGDDILIDLAPRD